MNLNPIPKLRARSRRIWPDGEKFNFVGNGLFAMAICAALVAMAAASIVVWGKWLTVGVLALGVLGFIGLAQPPRSEAGGMESSNPER